MNKIFECVKKDTLVHHEEILYSKKIDSAMGDLVISIVRSNVNGIEILNLAIQHQIWLILANINSKDQNSIYEVVSDKNNKWYHLNAIVYTNRAKYKGQCIDLGININCIRISGLKLFNDSSCIGHIDIPIIDIILYYIINSKLINDSNQSMFQDTYLMPPADKIISLNNTVKKIDIKPQEMYMFKIGELIDLKYINFTMDKYTAVKMNLAGFDIFGMDMRYPMGCNEPYLMSLIMSKYDNFKTPLSNMIGNKNNSMTTYKYRLAVIDLYNRRLLPTNLIIELSSGNCKLIVHDYDINKKSILYITEDNTIVNKL